MQQHPRAQRRATVLAVFWLATTLLGLPVSAATGFLGGATAETSAPAVSVTTASANPGAAQSATAPPASTPTAAPAATPQAEPAPSGEEDESVELTDAELSGNIAALNDIEQNAALDAQAKLAEVFTQYKTLGAVVCIIENGQVSHTFTYGSLNADGVPITPDTLFRVGSISKMVTAMGVMQLVESGKLSLDGDLSAALGFTLRNAQYPDTPVTLRQVMSHTAGFRDNGYYTQALRGDVAPLDQLFAGASNAYLFIGGFRAGTDTRYSNFGGGLLGSVLERATGETLDAYMAREVFTPLGITAAYQAAWLPAGVTVSDMYAMPSRTLAAAVRDGVPATATPNPFADYTLTAGKLTISAPDLAKLVIALCDGGVFGDARVLSATSAAAMRTAQNNVGSVSCQSNRGLCMNILPGTAVEGRTLYGHGGKANGMLCAAYFDPTDRTGVVMLTNGCNNRPMKNDVGMLTIAVLRLCYATLIDGQHITQDPWLVTE